MAGNATRVLLAFVHDDGAGAASAEFRGHGQTRGPGADHCDIDPAHVVPAHRDMSEPVARAAVAQTSAEQ